MRPQSHQDGASLDAEALGLREVDGPEARDDRDGDVGQDRHLQQLDEAVRHDRERSDHLAEEEPHGNAGGEAGQNLLRERHRLLSVHDTGFPRPRELSGPRRRAEDAEHGGPRQSGL